MERGSRRKRVLRDLLKNSVAPADLTACARRDALDRQSGLSRSVLPRIASKGACYKGSSGPLGSQVRSQVRALRPPRVTS